MLRLSLVENKLKLNIKTVLFCFSLDRTAEGNSVGRSALFNSQFESIRISPDGHSSFSFLFTETGICLKSSSSTKRIKGLFSTFAAISSQEVSRGLACKTA